MRTKSITVSGCLLLSLALSGCSIMQEIQNLQSDSSTVTTNSADEVKFPIDFPLPKYPNSKTTTATDTKVEKTRIRNVMMVSKVDADTICEYYKAWFERKGWTIKSPLQSQGVCTFLAAAKGDETANITAMHPKDSKETTLTINISSVLSSK